MPEAPGRTCLRCDGHLGSAAVRYDFALAVQAEVSQIDGPGSAGETTPQELLARMEAEGDWERYRAEVHTEVSGSLCAGCRSGLLRYLGAL